MTLAFFPLALVTIPVEDVQLYTINLTFVALLAAAYAVIIRWGGQKNSFSFKEILGLNAIYFVYLAVILKFIL